MRATDASGGPGIARREPPGQTQRREAIVAAARAVLLRDGLAGCTARAVADASPLTKSALHYYFSDMDEIVDLAVEELSTAFFSHVRSLGAGVEDPVARFWTVLREYLSPFEQSRPMTLLWFDYWTHAARRGDLGTVERIHGRIAELFSELLDNLDIEHADDRAHALVSYVLGTVLQQTVRALPFEQLEPEIADLCGLRQ